jgi:hypothetical protein
MQLRTRGEMAQHLSGVVSGVNGSHSGNFRIGGETRTGDVEDCVFDEAATGRTAYHRRAPAGFQPTCNKLILAGLQNLREPPVRHVVADYDPADRWPSPETGLQRATQR